MTYEIQFQHDDMEKPEGMEIHFYKHFCIVDARKYQWLALRNGNRFHHVYTVIDKETKEILYDGSNEPEYFEPGQRVRTKAVVADDLVWVRGTVIEEEWLRSNERMVKVRFDIGYENTVYPEFLLRIEDETM